MVHARRHADARFNVLLTEDREHGIEHWTRQLPRLLEPQGVRAFVARTGQEAVEIVGHVRVHAAVIDLATPAVGQASTEPQSPAPAAGGSAAQGDTDTRPATETPRPAVNPPRPSATGDAGGLWLLEVLRRLPAKPPTVVVSNRAYSARQAQRLLNDALRLGAFSVINRPVQLETLLAVIQRVIERQYRGQWPEEHHS